MGSKRSAGIFGVIAFALLSISGAALYGSTATKSPQTHTLQVKPALTADGAPQFSLIVEPQDGVVPVERSIEHASTSIDLVMYEFDDAQLESALAARAKEGVTVRVILDNGYFGAGSSINQEAFDYLRQNGVQVHWSPTYFALTHEKSIVVDGREALIMTFNFTPQYHKSDRDFGVVDDDPSDVAAVEQAFDSDWNGSSALAQNGDDLVWSPNSRDQLLAMINGAQTSLDIYNEEMQDPQIISALEAAAKRGVNVEVDMTYAANWKTAFTNLANAGVHVRTYSANAPLYIHAKVVIADGTKAFVGSENFSSTSHDQNRELGLIISDPTTVASLANTFAQDWQGASVFLVQ
jgi:cardiolipin synthase A/B